MSLSKKYEGGCFGTIAGLKDANLNKQGTEFIQDNYDKLVKYGCKLGLHEEAAHDLVHDAYIATYEDELNGAGFDPDYFSTGQMTVEAWIYSRIQKMSHNVKYRSDVLETNKRGSYKVEQAKLDSNGQVVYERDSNGEIKYRVGKDGKRVPVVAMETRSIQYTVVNSSFNTDVDDNDGFQAAYSLASTCDDLDEIENAISLAENIEYCIDICSLHDVKIVNIFKNIDSLGDMIASTQNNRVAYTCFKNLRELVKEHDELGEALASVLAVASSNRPLFNRALAAYI